VASLKLSSIGYSKCNTLFVYKQASMPTMRQKVEARIPVPLGRFLMPPSNSTVRYQICTSSLTAESRLSFGGIFASYRTSLFLKGEAACFVIQANGSVNTAFSCFVKLTCLPPCRTAAENEDEDEEEEAEEEVSLNQTSRDIYKLFDCV
jgi:hypothetical protein